MGRLQTLPRRDQTRRAVLLSTAEQSDTATLRTPRHGGPLSTDSTLESATVGRVESGSQVWSSRGES